MKRVEAPYLDLQMRPALLGLMAMNLMRESVPKNPEQKKLLAIAIAAIAIFLYSSGLVAGGASPEGRVVPGDEILVKMKLGEPVVYDNIIVKDNLSSDRLRLPAKQILRIPFIVKVAPMDSHSMANSTVSITNSTVEGWVDFKNTPLVIG